MENYKERSMSSRENILKALRDNTRETYDMPDLSHLKPITYADPVEEFKTKATTIAGAKLIEVKEGDNLNALIAKAYPEAKVVASNLKGIKSDINPDTVAEAQELERVDVGVIRGEIGVAENACIWIPQTMKERAVCFASEYLVIILSKAGIVNNMHEAYDRIKTSEDYFQQYKFGTFISGPSKTADIESALVYGAQAARGVTIFLIDN
jgi:L-lactate dehydrogenase complex protein LldG